MKYKYFVNILPDICALPEYFSDFLLPKFVHKYPNLLLKGAIYTMLLCRSMKN